MSLRHRIDVIRVESEEDRRLGVEVLQATYAREKRWVDDPEEQIPREDLGRDDVSWFVVRVDRRPVGILRVLYDPPLDLYREYDFELTVKGLDVEDFVRTNRIAEVGRFAVVPEYRRYVSVVAALMREASRETVARGYTHYITDVFEDDPHSPYRFHTRVMGFVPVATHREGELRSRSRRITLVLDLKQAYRRLRASGGMVYRLLTEGWDDQLHRLMST